MKRRMTLAALLAAAVLAFPTGCQKGIEEPGNGTSGKRFPGYDGLVVSIERGPRDTKNALGSLGSEAFTKTCLDAQDYVCWSDGDKVDVNGTTLSVLAPAFGEPSQDAMVSGGEPAPNASGRKYCGYFPASGYWNTSDKTIELPETRTYNPASPMEGVPMYAESDDKYLEFRSPFGLMEFNFRGDKTLLTLELTCTSGDLSGTFVIDASGNAVLKPGTTGTKKVTVNFGSGLSVDGGKKVYVALAPGTYSEMTITVTTTTTGVLDEWGGLYRRTLLENVEIRKGCVYANTFDTNKWRGVLMWYPEPGELGCYWARYNLGAFPGTNWWDWFGDYYSYGCVKTPYSSISYSSTSSSAVTYADTNPDPTRYLHWDKTKNIDHSVTPGNVPFSNVTTKTVKQMADTPNASDWTKYNSAGDVLALSDDAVSYQWGDNWRTMSGSEVLKLNGESTIAKVTSYNGVAVQGWKINSNTTGKEIFMPATGNMWGANINGCNSSSWMLVRDRTAASGAGVGNISLVAWSVVPPSLGTSYRSVATARRGVGRF